MSADDLPADRVARIQDEWRRERPDLDVSPQGVIGRLHRVAAHLTAELERVYEQHGLGEGEFDIVAGACSGFSGTFDLRR